MSDTIYTSEKAKEQFEARKQMQDDDEARIMRANQRELDRARREGEPNWALYNLILYTTDYSNVDFSCPRDAMFTFYKRIWPYINSMNRDIAELKEVIVDKFIEDPESEDSKKLLELLRKPTPTDMAVDTLTKFKEAAKARAKRGVYELPKKKIIT